MFIKPEEIIKNFEIRNGMVVVLILVPARALCLGGK